MQWPTYEQLREKVVELQNDGYPRGIVINVISRYSTTKKLNGVRKKDYYHLWYTLHHLTRKPFSYHPA